MRFDAIIVGGSFAGLSAALQVARARRSVLVIDAGRPRNRFAATSHGLFGHDGRAGSDLLAEARAQLAVYPKAAFLAGEAIRAHRKAGAFTIDLASGDSVEARRLVLATGLVDVLPTLPGLAERWGQTVLHCAYCDGYELGGGAIGVLATVPSSTQQALLLADWGEVTFFTDGKIQLDVNARGMLARRRVKIETGPVVALEGTAPKLDGIRLQDGRVVPVPALFLSAPMRMASPLAEQLGCAIDAGPLGPIVRTDPWKLTSIPGVFAAGDLARFPHNASWATADGASAGIALHGSLINEELAVLGPVGAKR